MMPYKNKIYSSAELKANEIFTDHYNFNFDEGIYIAELVLKAQSYKGPLRLFFKFEDGRDIIAVTHWYNKYLGFKEIPVGTKLKLIYKRNESGVYLRDKEIIETPPNNNT